MNACKWKPSTVTLHDGRQVASNSQEWLRECEARHVLKQPTIEARRTMLAAIEKKRGAEARQELEQRALAIWQSARGVL